MTTTMIGRATPLDEGGFEDFYRDHWHDAVRLAGWLTGSLAAGEDIAQDVFQKMYRSWGRAEEPGAYLRVALLNSSRSWHRRRQTERAGLPLLARADLPASTTGELGDVVDALPERQRAVVLLRYWLGMSEEEIAVELGCRRGTVKSLSSRARGRLAVALAS